MVKVAIMVEKNLFDKLNEGSCKVLVPFFDEKEKRWLFVLKVKK